MLSLGMTVNNTKIPWALRSMEITRTPPRLPMRGRDQRTLRKPPVAWRWASRAGSAHFFPAHHNNASNPLRSSKFSTLSDGPLGCFSPISHLRTVDALVLSTEAITV